MKFILTADWHLRGDRPRCRIDEDWVGTQIAHLEWLVDLANAKRLPICAVGDLCNTARIATEVVARSISVLKKANHGLYILAGNHDLPYHSYENVLSSSYGILLQSFEELGSEKAQTALGLHNANPFGLDNGDSAEEVVFTHQLVFESEAARPIEECGKIPEDLLKEFPNAKWIFTGDYHVNFHHEQDGRHVVNPGCLNRQVADKMDYVPVVAIVDTELGTVEFIPVPDKEEMVTDNYLRVADEREDRLETFLELVSNKEKVSLSFIDNLENSFHEVPQDVIAECRSIYHTAIKGEA